MTRGQASPALRTDKDHVAKVKVRACAIKSKIPNVSSLSLYFIIDHCEMS